MLELMAPLQIHQVGSEEQSAAIKLLRRFSDQNLTLADALGLHLMEVFNVSISWSTDFHLGLTGIPLVIYTH